MQAYLFTLLCLMSLASLVSFRAIEVRKQAVQTQLIEREELYFSLQRSIMAEMRYQQTKPKVQASPVPRVAKVGMKKKRRYRSLKVPFTSPPNNSRLNLYAFLTEPESIRQEEGSWYFLFVRLIKLLYVDTGCIAPGMESMVAEALLAKKEELLEIAKKHGEEGLVTLNLPPQEAHALYVMLKGVKKNPSLLNFLCYEEKPQSKLNLLFAHPVLLQALVPHPAAYQELSALRSEIMEEVRYQEQEIQQHGQQAALDFFRTRTDFRIELRDRTQIILSRYNILLPLNHKRLDFSLGSSGDYVFFTDPYTGQLVRSRCSIQAPK